MPDEIFNVSSEPNAPARDNKEVQREPRRFLGVQFDCCRTYSRIYANHNHTAFVGHCPRCGKQVHIKISPDGADTQFFSAR